MTDWTELKRLAEEATGGDWEFRLGLIRTQPDSDGYVPVAVAPNSPKNWRNQRDLNMQFIAAANPKTILALLAENERLSGECEGCPMSEVERLREERDSQQRICIKAIEERNKLRAEADVLRSIAIELRGWVSCQDVNHRSVEFHESDEPCKVLARIDSAISKAHT